MAKPILLKLSTFKKMDLPGIDKRWERVLALSEKGDGGSAATLAAEILEDEVAANAKSSEKSPASDRVDAFLESSRDQIKKIVSSILIGTISNISFFSQAPRKSFIRMLSAGAEAGYDQCAYNVANLISESAKTPEDFKIAEHYYLMAVEAASDPSSKGAALVNYCAIVRDGLITGKKDYPKAIEIYEQAAELGLVTGMFNAANVSFWLDSSGDSSFMPVANHWLEKLIDHVRTKKPLLEMDNKELIRQVYPKAHIMLAQIHIEGKIPDASIQYAIKLLEEFAPDTQESRNAKNYFLSLAKDKKLTKIDAPIERSPGNHWRYVLNNMGWKVGAVNQINSLDSEIFSVVPRPENADPIPFVVINALFKPDGSLKAPLIMAQELAKKGIHEFFMAPSHALFTTHGDKIYTAVVHVKNLQPTLLSINPESTVDGLLDNARKRINFLDPKNASNSCVLSIAINRLNQGLTVKDGFDYYSQAFYWAGWSAAFVGEIPQFAEAVE